MEKTCKQCKYYEKYEGTECASDGKPALFTCDIVGISYYNNTDTCSAFDPKGKCKTCRFSSFNNDGRTCGDDPDAPKGLCGYSDGFRLWQPIASDRPILERLKDKSHVKKFGDMRAEERDFYEKVGKKNCLYKCGDRWIKPDYVVAFCPDSTYIINPAYRPGQFTISPEEYTMQQQRDREEGWRKAAVAQKATKWDCKDCQHCSVNLFAKPCDECLGGSCYIPKKEETKFNRKEPKMKVTKLIFWPLLRRYVATCVVLVTAKICIWLNPLVCAFWYWIVPEELFDGPNWENKGVCWIFTFVAIATVILALWLYNQFCIRICRIIGRE